MIRACFLLLFLISGLLRAGFTPQFKAIYDQAHLSATKNNQAKALLLLQKSKPQTPADSGLYYYLEGFLCYLTHKGDSAVIYYKKAITLLNKTKNFREAATSYNDLGNQLLLQGKLVEAIESFQYAINVFAQAGDTIAGAGALHNIGRIYMNQGDMERAEQYTRRAIVQNKTIKNDKWLERNYNQMASIFVQRNIKDSALKYSNAMLQIGRKSGNKLQEARALQMFGVCYGTFNELKLARKYFDSALVIRLEVNDSIEILNSYGALGEISMLENNLASAKNYMAKALEISTQIKNVDNVISCAEILFQIAEKERNYKDMYSYYRLQRTLDDSLHNQRISKQLLEKEYQFNFEKKEAELKAENEKKFIRAEEEKKKQRMILLFVGLGLLAMLVFAVILYGRLKLIRKQNKLIEAQKKLVEEKQKQTELQKDVIVAKQKEIVDSIRYAQRIQSALIANEIYIARVLKELTDPGRRKKK